MRPGGTEVGFPPSRIAPNPITHTWVIFLVLFLFLANQPFTWNHREAGQWTGAGLNSSGKDLVFRSKSKPTELIIHYSLPSTDHYHIPIMPGAFWMVIFLIKTYMNLNFLKTLCGSTLTTYIIPANTAVMALKIWILSIILDHLYKCRKIFYS